MLGLFQEGRILNSFTNSNASPLESWNNFPILTPFPCVKFNIWTMESCFFRLFLNQTLWISYTYLFIIYRRHPPPPPEEHNY